MKTLSHVCQIGGMIMQITPAASPVPPPSEPVLNRPGFTGELLVQILSCFFSGIQGFIEVLLCFMGGDVIDFAV